MKSSSSAMNLFYLSNKFCNSIDFLEFTKCQFTGFSIVYSHYFVNFIFELPFRLFTEIENELR